MLAAGHLQTQQILQEALAKEHECFGYLGLFLCFQKNRGVLGRDLLYSIWKFSLYRERLETLPRQRASPSLEAKPLLS